MEKLLLQPVEELEKHFFWNKCTKQNILINSGIKWLYNDYQMADWQQEIEINWVSMKFCRKNVYHVDLEKRGGCGMVARERHESHMS